MTGELFFACVVDPAVWLEAFRAEGLELTEEGRSWTVTAPTRAAHLDPIEVRKLIYGVAFGGFSPRDIAARIALSLASAG